MKMDLRDMGWGGVEWINLAQDSEQLRVIVNTEVKFRVQLNIGNY
jgi:hypothetical protein